MSAFDEEDIEINVPEEKIGKVAVCSNQCGAIIRVIPVSTGVTYVQISEDGVCPVCGIQDSIEEELRGIHCVVDDTSVFYRQEQIAKSEREGVAPLRGVDFPSDEGLRLDEEE